MNALRLVPVVALLVVGCSNGGSVAGQDAAVPTARADALSVVTRHAVFAQAVDRAHPPVEREAGFERASLAPGAPHAVLPKRIDAPVSVAVSQGSKIAFVPLDVTSVGGRLDGGAVVYADASPSTDVVLVPRWNGYEELRVLHDDKARTTYRWRVELPAGYTMRLHDRAVEAVDETGRVQLAAEPMYALDAHDVRRELSVHLEGGEQGPVLVASLDTGGLAYPITVDPVWSSGPSNISGAASFSIVLNDGRLMAGLPNGPYNAWLYNPSTNAWTATATYPSGWGSNAVGEKLADGRVLLVDPATSQARIYNPTTNTFAVTNNSGSGCSSCVMARAGDGRILKLNPSNPYGELWSPTTGAWTTTNLPSSTGTPAVAVTLADGRVLTLNSVGQTPFIFNPTGSAWTTGTGSVRLSGARGVLLADNRVMFLGGVGTSGVPPVGTPIYNPATDSWSYTSTIARRRWDAALMRLPNNRVLAVGGWDGSTYYYADAEIWDPVTNMWTLIDSMAEPHAKAAFGAFSNGRAIVTGGLGNFGSPTGATAIYTPLANGSSCAGSAAATCAAQFCVDGVCCASASCPNGTCAAPAGAGRAAGSCALDQGQKCTSNAQCSTNFCVDGVCCNSACTGQCESCSVLGSAGTCTAVVGAPTGGRPACSGAGAGTACGSKCNGSNRTACVYAASGTVACGTNSCTAGTETVAGTCNGAGTCVTTTKSCGAYGCGASACKASCVTEADCAAGYYCGGDKCLPKVGLGSTCTSTSMCPSGLSCTDGVCCGVASCGEGSACNLEPTKGTCKKLLGTACTSKDECGSGVCVDGVCCNRACDAQCEACDLPSSKGTCSAVSGAPRGSRPACSDGGGDACKALECDGAKDPTACSKYKNGGTVTCKTASCDGATLVPQSTCDGAGSCVTPPVAACGRYSCDPGRLVCRTSCDTSADCATGFLCVAGVCSEGARCSDDGLSSLSTDGRTQDCTPYRCNTIGTCGDKCTVSADCAGGYICDGTRCTASTPAPVEDGGGCAMTPRSAGYGSTLIVALAALALKRRRRAAA